MQYKRVKRRIDGVLLLDKPVGLSSNQALQQVKRLFQAEKAGHTGSLDPFATGLLPICLGEATKFSHFLLDADKTYRATLQFGATSTTGDTEGEIISCKEIEITPAKLQAVLREFMGTITQIPPMYSALKHQGKALYEYARAGVEIERKPREIKILRLELLNLSQSQAEIEVECSKGTYIRTLAEDIGARLGCGAYLTQLRRIATADFDLTKAITLPQLESISMAERESRLLFADVLLQPLPAITLDKDSTYYLGQGQAVWLPGIRQQGQVRLYAETGRFLGLGEVADDGRVAPRRLLAS